MDALTPYALSSSLPLRRRRLPLVVDIHPCGRRRARTAGRRCPYGLAASWLLAAGGASARRQPSYWRRAHRRSPACGLLPLRVAWLQPTGPCSRPGRGWLALHGGWLWVAGPPWGVGHGWPPLLLAAFVAKTQQERVERFYAIQSHHTQFKTNLSHENLGSDTTIGKPQRVHHMCSGNQNKNRFLT
ncbi:hypothetical protein GW17_00056486 [Ensete ventricosum]|nr:hypothetical protein GW17_00056486 [Ensete ventricosum]